MKDDLAGKLYQEITIANVERKFHLWHASSISECPRSHYYKRLGIERLNRDGAGKMLRWEVGHLFENSLRPHLKKIYPDLESNMRLENLYIGLTGEFDNYSEDAKTIIEVKSVHDRAFIYRKKFDTRFHLLDKKPYLSHQLQNHCYVRLLQSKGKEVETIQYIYTTLDGRIATYSTPVSDKLLSEVDNRLEILNNAWKSKTPPECICNKTDHPLYKNTMQYCVYKTESGCCDIKLWEENSNVRV